MRREKTPTELVFSFILFLVTAFLFSQLGSDSLLLVIGIALVFAASIERNERDNSYIEKLRGYLLGFAFIITGAVKITTKMPTIELFLLTSFDIDQRLVVKLLWIFSWFSISTLEFLSSGRLNVLKFIRYLGKNFLIISLLLALVISLEDRAEFGN